MTPLTDIQKGYIFYCILIFLVAVGIVVLASVKPTKAEVSYPAPIPTECVELAQRENRPLEIKNKAAALAAKARLYLMKRDALVDQCRDGVKRVEAAIKAMKQGTPK